MMSKTCNARSLWQRCGRSAMIAVGKVGSADAPHVLRVPVDEWHLFPHLRARETHPDRATKGIRVGHLQTAVFAVQLGRVVRVVLHVETHH